MSNKEINEEELFMYDWVFHFNPYTKEWAAVPRENYNDYWCNADNSNVLRSSKFETLHSLLYKTKGNNNAIEKLLNGKK